MRRARLPFLSIATLLASACDSTEPSVPTTVSLAPQSISFDATGATDTIIATIVDQRGDRMGGVPLTWSVDGGAVTVKPLGGDSAVVTSAGNGSAIVRVTAREVSGEVVATVAQMPTALVRVDGLNQRGVVGTTLATPLRVAVRDRLGSGIPGRPITFTVTAGEGSVSASDAVTGPDGIASVEWTLGTSTSSGQELTVTSEGVPSGLSFSATATSGTPASISAFRGDGQSAPTRQDVPIPPAALVSDIYGNPVQDVLVYFQVTEGDGIIFPSTGLTAANGTFTLQRWRLGPSPGPNRLRASVTSRNLVVDFAATAMKTGTIAAAAGARQAAPAGAAVPVNPTVAVRDDDGIPVPGVTVTFSVLSGGGAVTNRTTVTDVNGLASTGWTLGPAPTRNRIEASANLAEGVTVSTTFDAAGCGGGGGSGYSITLCYTSDVGASQRLLFETAADRWSSVIIGDLPDVSVDLLAPCPNSPSLRTTVDDLLIFVAVMHIDGPGGTLGQAGPCHIRGSSSLPIIGLMQFDEVDVANLSNTLVQTVILHEMAHAMGVGSLWNYLGLVENPSSTTSRLDTYFTGPAAIAAFDALGGTVYSGGRKVPVENEGGQGTINSHWRESVLRNELMTGFINAGTNPLSLLTIQSLADLGYSVNPGAADPYVYSPLSASRAPDGGQEGVQLVDDVLDIPLQINDGPVRGIRAP